MGNYALNFHSSEHSIHSQFGLIAFLSLWMLSIEAHRFQWVDTAAFCLVIIPTVPEPTFIGNSAALHITKISCKQVNFTKWRQAEILWFLFYQLLSKPVQLARKFIGTVSLCFGTNTKLQATSRYCLYKFSSNDIPIKTQLRAH